MGMMGGMGVGMMGGGEDMMGGMGIGSGSAGGLDLLSGLGGDALGGVCAEGEGLRLALWVG